MIKRGFLAVLLFLASQADPALPSPNVETMKAIIKMQSKIDSLERKTAYYDSTLLMLDMKLSEAEFLIAHNDSLPADTVKRLHRQFGVPAMGKQDFTIGVGATMVLQGTNKPNAVARGNKRVGDAAYSANVTFEKKFTAAASRAFLRCEAAGGRGLDDDVQVFSRVNFDALGPQGVQVAEAWYEQSFLNGGILGTIGLLDPSIYFDDNKAAHDETVQFLSQIFVENPLIEYPHSLSRAFYAPGIIGRFMGFGDRLTLSAGIFDADRDWQRIGDNLFGIGQLAVASNIAGARGNYRFYSWYNQNPHRRWDDSLGGRANSWGFGVSFDQRIGQALTLFLRYGTRDPQTYDPSALTDDGPYSTIFEHSWSAGAQVGGGLWLREHDALGIAVGQLPLSGKFKEMFPERQAKSETHMELYYKIQCFDKMSISPDLQYILNPFGGDGAYGAGDIPVVGIRSEVDF
jgi:hypothetical protein